MPKWTHSPPDDPRGPGLPILRTPAASPLRAIVTSTDLVGCDTHFWGGHTIPCERPDCDACNAGIPYRWHAYLTAYNDRDCLHFLFECTAQAAANFVDYREQHKTLRACLFEAYRWRRTRNGRVIIKCEQWAGNPAVLPRPPDLTKLMAIIWRLPQHDVWTRGAHRQVPMIHADSSRDGSSSDPRDYTTPSPP